MAGAISSMLRKKTATVRTGGKDKFPIFSADSARAAEHLKGHAKPPLTSSQSAAVDKKAAQFGVGGGVTSRKPGARGGRSSRIYGTPPT